MTVLTTQSAGWNLLIFTVNHQLPAIVQIQTHAKTIIKLPPIVHLVMKWNKTTHEYVACMYVLALN